MGTKIHFTESDSIEVDEELDEVVERLDELDWVRLQQAGGRPPVVVNAATVRYVFSHSSEENMQAMQDAFSRANS